MSDNGAIMGSVGLWGWAQLKYVLLICCLIFLNQEAVLSPWIFATPLYQCAPNSEAEQESQFGEWNVSESIPTTLDPHAAKLILDGCHQFVNVMSSDVLNATSSLVSEPALVTCTDIQFSCCEPFKDTAVTEFGLVCENEWKRALAQSMLGAGFLAGSIIFGQISDRIGRRKTVLLAYTVKFVSITIMLSTSTYISFVGAYFLFNMAGYGVFICLYVLMIELICPSKRFLQPIFVDTFGTLSEVIIITLFQHFPEWRLLIKLNLFYLLCGFFIASLFLLESPLWLLSQNRLSEARLQLLKIARLNNKKDLLKVETRLDELMEQRKSSSRSVSKEPKQVYFIHLFTSGYTIAIKTVIICLNWITCASSFYSIYLNLTSFHSSDPFISMTISALIGLPSICFVMILSQYLGRRLTFVLTLLSGALTAIASVFVYHENTVVLLALAGRFCFGGAFGLIYTWSSELYPTVVRNAGMGFSSLTGRIGLLLVPFILEWGLWGQVLTCGVSGIMSATLSLFLPETLNQEMMQTLEESRNRNLRSCSSILKMNDDKVKKMPVISYKQLVLEADDVSLNEEAEEEEMGRESPILGTALSTEHLLSVE